MKLKSHHWQIIVCTLILLLVAVASQAQYVSLSIDPNSLLKVVENPRTKVQNQGIDFDVEVGAITEQINLGAYLFYGRFEEADYQNYGAGADYYLIDNKNISVSAGAGPSVVLRKIYWQDQFRAWGSYLAWHGRVNGVLWIDDALGITSRLQYQRRPEIECKGIIEGYLGLRIKI